MANPSNRSPFSRVPGARLVSSLDIPRRVAHVGLKAIGGWRFVTPLPTVDKYVTLGWPHTSNMDGLVMLLLANAHGMEINWLIKDDWDVPILGAVMKGWGAVYVRRSKSHGLVEQMVEEFERRDHLALLVPPEGTRSRVDHWKSGFYHIAHGAKVPVIPAFMDYSRKQAGFGPPVEITGNARADMDQLRAFYAKGDYKGRFPDEVGPIRLRDEADADDAGDQP